MKPSSRMAPAILVALLVGGLRAVQMNLPRLLVGGGLATEGVGLVLSGVGLLSLLASPFGVAAAGYLWGTGADVSREWLAFAVALFAAALCGFVVAAVVSLVAGLALSGHAGPALLVRLVSHGVAAVGLVGVAFSGLAGAAVAQFRTGESRNSSSVPA